MKHILITGAGGVIGSQIAQTLYQPDVQLILLDKNKKRLEQTCTDITALDIPAPEPVLVHQNLNKIELIDQLGLTLYQTFAKLDGFISCHNILESLGPLSHYNRASWDKMLLVNLTANLRLIQSFDPLFQKSEQANLIFLSTKNLMSEDKSFWGVHMAIQSALEALVRSYQCEKSHTAIHAHILDPGLVSSDFLHQAYPGSPEGKHTLSQDFLAQIEGIFSAPSVLEKSA